MNKKTKTKNIILFIVLCLGSLFVVVPFVWMILSSFKSIDEFYLMPPKILPREFSMDNFNELF